MLMFNKLEAIINIVFHESMVPLPNGIKGHSDIRPSMAYETGCKIDLDLFKIQKFKCAGRLKSRRLEK